MFKRYLRPIPVILMIFVIIVSYYLFSLFMPKVANQVTTFYPIQNTFETLVTPELIQKITQESSEILTKNSQKNFVVSKIELATNSSNIFPQQIVFQKNGNYLESTLIYTPSFFPIKIQEDIKNKVTETLSSLAAKKVQLEIQTLESKKKILLNEIETLKTSIPHEVIKEEKKEEPSVGHNVSTTDIKIPQEIANHILLLKEFKTRKEAQLNEIQTQLKELSLPTQTPLVMLTSNLQKFYEMQITLLDSKKAWGKQWNASELASFETEKNKVSEKLIDENIRLRDESYYLKEIQDKALREKTYHLLITEKNLQDTLNTLNSLQQALTFQKQPSKEVANEAPNVNNNLTKIENKNNDKIKSLEIEIANIENELKQIALSITAQENIGPAKINSEVKQIEIHYLQNIKIVTASLITFFLLYTLIALIFGSSNKLSHPKAIAEILDATYLGTIPDFPNEGLENTKQKRLTEAIETITQNLLDLMQNQNNKILNIISPEQNDGRTQLVGMLCLSFNLKKDMKIIALDTCFQNPKLASFLELKNKPSNNEIGLITYIKHLIQISEISEDDNNEWLAKLVKPTVRNGVFVISPGEGNLEDVYSFNSKIITTMYEGLSKYVDLIIADTPALNSTESFIPKVLSENTHGNIMLLRKNKYTKKQLENIKKNIVGAKLMGFVIK